MSQNTEFESRHFLSTTELFNKLTSYFANPAESLRNPGGNTLDFVGAYGINRGDKTVFQNALGYRVLPEILEFIDTFGGTTLFVDEYGLGLKVYEIDSIYQINLELQETTVSFWYKFALFAADTGSGDFLCLYYDGRNCHFGVLDHEAWGEEPDVWAKDATMFCYFDKWLEHFVLSGGEIIPPKNARYQIET